MLLIYCITGGYDLCVHLLSHIISPENTQYGLLIISTSRLKGCNIK